jgi:hypothetical protein
VRLHIIDSNCFSLALFTPRSVASFKAWSASQMIHGHTLNEPHRCRASTARAMDERWFRSFSGNGVEKVVRLALRFDVHARLGRFAQIDHRYPFS